MKTILATSRSTFVVAFAAAGLLVAGGCASGEQSPAEEAAEAQNAVEQEVDELREQVAETAGAMREFTYAEKEQFDSWADRQIESIDTQLEELENRIAGLDDAAKARWEETRTELDERRQALESELREAMSATEEQWSEATSSAARSIEEFGKSVSDALERLSTDSTS